ncbi:MAG: hypothetical protein QXO71_10455, partial [Candidatus Jordarchaeaceae archaeon]
NALLSDQMEYVVARAAKELGFKRGQIGLAALNGGPVPFPGKKVAQIVQEFGTNFRIASPDILG